MRTRRIVRCLSVAILLVLAVAPSAGAKVYINIDSPSAQKFPIAVTTFKNMNNAAGQDSLSPWFADTLGKTLEITGYFNVLDRKAFLVDQAKLGIATENIPFPAWSGIGAESLVTGGFTVSGRDLTLECRLFDVVQGKLLVGKRYTGKIEERKEMVVRFAQEILVALTGEKGLFDTKIAFAGKKGGSSEIYAVNYDGTEPVKLTNFGSITLSPKWSPDGRQISFLSYKDGNPDLHVMDLNRRTTRRILSTGRLNLPASWSPDSKRMLVTSSKDGSEDIYILNLADGRMTRLTQDPAIDVSPTWSPDGKQIAFVSDRGGTPQIYLMDAGGANVRRLTFEGGYNTSPAWHPRANRIAYEGRAGGSFQIMVIEAEGGMPVQLTPNGGRNENPAWSPDGRYIAFVSRAGGKSRVCVMNANGTNVRVIHEGLDAYVSPTWSPHLNFY
ncbi:MAG TPA: Tol-Pal system beta propeller repeat protein TolB [Syntrophales bacterium]|nr:Tol-Pal system beta propeller repeat protein TolB [Syntrophobacterales bacterium]HQL89567.1 Tol-Pal system beta propeller repeat protein TolB [Syntrophales bacterium]